MCVLGKFCLLVSNCVFKCKCVFVIVLYVLCVLTANAATEGPLSSGSPCPGTANQPANLQHPPPTHFHQTTHQTKPQHQTPQRESTRVPLPNPCTAQIQQININTLNLHSIIISSLSAPVDFHFPKQYINTHSPSLPLFKPPYIHLCLTELHKVHLQTWVTNKDTNNSINKALLKVTTNNHLRNNTINRVLLNNNQSMFNNNLLNLTITIVVWLV